MKSHKYELVVWWSDEDEVFVVDVPELPGCMAHGATIPDAIANARLVQLRSAVPCKCPSGSLQRIPAEPEAREV